MSLEKKFLWLLKSVIKSNKKEVPKKAHSATNEENRGFGSALLAGLKLKLTKRLFK